MAVDTRARRLSMLNFSSGALLPDPSGSVDAPARLTLLDLYSGIAAQGITIASHSRRRRMYFNWPMRGVIIWSLGGY